MSRNYTFSPGEFYHVYNRGVDKRTIYLDDADHKRFSLLLYLSNSTDAVHIDKVGRGSTSPDYYEIERPGELVDVVAYCHMPNHFHILIKEKADLGISKFMQKLSTGYTMYFNKRYERTGSLFQGKFKASQASSDQYLKYLFSYIHLNPVKLIQPNWKERGIYNLSKTKEFLDSYNHSSFHDYVGKIRKENAIVNTNAYPGYFQNVNEMYEEITDWLTLET